MVDHLHRGRRIVHRRGQRADRDVDHDPHRERGILLDRALDTERDHRTQLRIGSRVGRSAVDLDERRACRDEVADRMAKDDEALVRVRPAPEPVHVDRLDRSASLHPDDEHGLALWAIRRGNDRRRAGSRSGLENLAERASSSLRDERCHSDGPQPVDRAVEEDHEEQDPEPEDQSRDRDPEVRHAVRFDVPHERVGEGEGADQHREHGLERPVAVEDPHVASGERARRHLHDQHADRYDEPHEPDARGHDRGENGLSSARRVLPAGAQVDDRAEVRPTRSRAASRALRR